MDDITLGAELIFDVSCDDEVTQAEVAIINRFMSPSPVDGTYLLEDAIDLVS